MKKKILLIYYQNIKQNGISKSISNLTKNLIEDGYDVTILFLMTPHQDFFPIDDRVEKIYIDSFATPQFERAKKIKSTFRVKGKLNNLLHNLYDWGVFLLLQDWISKNENHYDIIIPCWYKLATYLTFTECAHKTIAWEHINYKTGGLIYYNLLRHRYKKLKGIVCLTESSLEYYKKLNPYSIKIPNIIGDQFENYVLNINEKNNNILVASRLDPEKNVKDFLDIIKDIVLPEDSTVTIAGTGIQEKELIAYARQLKIDKVKFAGSLSPDKMFQLYKESKIFCMTSLFEGLPTTLIEAMFCGNVLLSYDCPTGPAEIITENNGFLIPLKDKPAFRTILQTLIDDPFLLEGLIKKSHKEADKWKKSEIIDKWKLLLR